MSYMIQERIKPYLGQSPEPQWEDVGTVRTADEAARKVNRLRREAGYTGYQGEPEFRYVEVK